MRVAYLGPAGTYTHAALGAGELDADTEEVPLTTIHEVVAAVATGQAQRGVVPIENSVEGSVNATLDALAFETGEVRIIGEAVLEIHHCLIGRAGLAIDDVRVVVSHPQALAQCAGFLRDRVSRAEVRTETSTAQAVRSVLRGSAPWAALGPRNAAELYGGRVLSADVEDVAGNETRFAWLAHADAASALAPAEAVSKTAVVFWPRESDHPGWLVDVLGEFSRRGVNLTRIESRPRKVGLGEYVFFVDLAGSIEQPAIAEGLAGVRAHVAQLRVLGSFPCA